MTSNMKIILTKKAQLKLKYFVELAEGEISGVGKSRFEGENIIMEDVIIFKQECSSARTILDDEAQAKFMYEMIKADEVVEDWNIWWHSHASMAVFWSATDDATVKAHSGQDYLISLVTNKAGEFKARVDSFAITRPFNIKVFSTTDIPVEQYVEEDEELYMACIEEVATKVTKPVVPERTYVKGFRDNKDQKKLPYYDGYDDYPYYSKEAMQKDDQDYYDNLFKKTRKKWNNPQKLWSK